MKKTSTFIAYGILFISMSYIIYYQLELAEIASIQFKPIYQWIYVYLANPVFIASLAFAITHIADKMGVIKISVGLRKKCKIVALCLFMIYLLSALGWLGLQNYGLLVIFKLFLSQSWIFFCAGGLLFLGLKTS